MRRRIPQGNFRWIFSIWGLSLWGNILQLLNALNSWTTLPANRTAMKGSRVLNCNHFLKLYLDKRGFDGAGSPSSIKSCYISCKQMLAVLCWRNNNTEQWTTFNDAPNVNMGTSEAINGAIRKWPVRQRAPVLKTHLQTSFSSSLVLSLLCWLFPRLVSLQHYLLSRCSHELPLRPHHHPPSPRLGLYLSLMNLCSAHMH